MVVSNEIGLLRGRSRRSAAASSRVWRSISLRFKSGAWRAKNTMEILLQCLDDLDDLAFAVALTLERPRGPSLQAGFSVALTLVLVALVGRLGGWVPALTWSAIGILVVWAAGLIAPELSRLLDPARRASISPNA
jgi:hypothetical protein